MPYGTAKIHAMTSTEKSNLDQLLEQQDPDLLDWFLGKSIPKDSSIADAVRHVLTFSNERERARET
jgi:succinate dehydrogenase flavin-adding protein (antitoxin of CptAB toxin-antitoxin module)